MKNMKEYLKIIGWIILFIGICLFSFWLYMASGVVF